MPKKKVTRVAIETPAPVKRGPGRPRKIESTTARALQAMSTPAVEPAKRSQGRPRKVAVPPAATTSTAKARTPVAKAATTTATSAGNGKPKAGTKTEKIYNLLTRKKGCTRPEVLEEVGWPSISMQHTAQILKLKLRTEKPANGPTRYYGSP